MAFYYLIDLSEEDVSGLEEWSWWSILVFVIQKVHKTQEFLPKGRWWANPLFFQIVFADTPSPHLRRNGPFKICA